MISFHSPSPLSFSPREASIANAHENFPNLLAQTLSQISLFSGSMRNHIDRHQSLYERYPAYKPSDSNPAFQTLTPKSGVDQSIMMDGDYRLDMTKNGTSSSTYKVYDRSGKELAGAWGDPHMTGRDGAALGDMQGNHVLTLPNGIKMGVRVSDGNGAKPTNGNASYASEITVTSARGDEAMNFNFNNGTNKPMVGCHISGYLGENFNAETLGDHGPFMGAQLGVSKEGGLFDPLTGQSMTAQKLKEMDLNNGDPVAREKAMNLSMAQQLFGQGYVTPRDNLLYGAHSFKSFTEPMRNQCTNNLQSLLSQMTRINATGCGCGMRLPNHRDGDMDIMLQSFGRMPKPYACPTLSTVYNPMMANAMPEGAACKTIGQYMQQMGSNAVSIQDLQRIANDKNAPPMVRNACSWMDQHRDAFDRIEQMDAPNQKDNWSGVGNFLNRANQLGAQDWTPTLIPPKFDFFFNRRPLFWA